MLYDAKSFWNESKRMIKAICFLVILSSIFSVATSAMAASEKEKIDKFIQCWEKEYGESSYWKVGNAPAASVTDEQQSHVENHLSTLKGYRSEAALHDTVKRFLNAYGATPQSLDMLWPVLQSLRKIEGGQLPLYSMEGQQ